MSNTHVPVLIVGAGAAGLTCSALLAQRAVRSLLVERRRERFIYPKARNLSFRSLEILRRLGLADEVHKTGEGVASVVVKPALNSPEATTAMDVDAIFAGMDELSPEETIQYCPQSHLEPLLLAETRRLGSTVRYGTELVSWETGR
jgi:2-polyprenyl-6-methoxyphenol hydroxylase-like FAD-dependent oxidoreductase